jgi:hypothetical protein
MRKRSSVLKVGFWCLMLAIGTSSCSRYYYRPNSVNAPLLANAGDVHIMGGIMPDETDELNYSRTDNTIWGVQMAASPIKHIGIIGSYTKYKCDITSNTRPEEGMVDARANVWDIGAGGYYIIREKDRGLKFLVDMYAGYGWGDMKSDVNMDLNKIFLQPGIGLRTDYFDVAFNLRFNGVKYSNLQTNGMSDNYLDIHGIVTDYGKSIVDKRHFFVEPAFTIRGGYKFVKAQMQVTHASAIQNVPWRYNSTLFTAGIYFALEDLLRLKK